ncbi:MAG: TPM domain-containing protein [Phycisphaerales bacterium]|nr:TPM domain-containing protein [Phycisphaerales bacterium]
MNEKHFFEPADEDRIVDAIKHAEAKTSGEIRVFVAKNAANEPLTTAEKHFHALGMTNTRDRNAILIFLAPKSHTFAIVGDTAIHQRCGNTCWTTLCDEMNVHLKQGHHTDAILHVVARAGDLLARHFPANPDDNPNQLPNTIVRD